MYNKDTINSSVRDHFTQIKDIQWLWNWAIMKTGVSMTQKLIPNQGKLITN